MQNAPGPAAQLEDSLRAALTIRDPEQRAETLRMFAEILMMVLASRDYQIEAMREDTRTTQELLRAVLGALSPGVVLAARADSV